MKVVQELVAYFDRRGKLSRRQLRGLLEQNLVASDAPANMHGLCETVGATYYFRVTGVTEGQLWGTDIYSGDSTIGAAAVHAGLLKPGETDVLRVTVATPPEKFPGTVRNGVTSTEHGRYQYPGGYLRFDRMQIASPSSSKGLAICEEVEPSYRV